MKDNEGKNVTRRTVMLALLAVGLMAILIGRLGYLQIFQNDHYAHLAEGNRLGMRVLLPTRGKILDRLGNELASSRKTFKLTAIPDMTFRKKDWTEHRQKKLSQLLDIEEHELEELIKKHRHRPGFLSLVLKENLSWEEVARLEMDLTDFPGIQVEEAVGRSYQEGNLFGSVMGALGPMSEAQMEGDRLLLHADMRVGKSGIEHAFDSLLRGKVGLQKIEVNARGKYVRNLDTLEAVPGTDVTLTLDLELQRLLMEELSVFPAAAGVVLDVHSGEILAMVSQPSFDPTLFAYPISKEIWHSLQFDPLNPLVNKAISGLYAPGSALKMCVSLAALEAEICTPQTRFGCAGQLVLGSHPFHCWNWRKGGHGSMSLKNALKHSCDVFFYEIGKRLDIDKVAQMAEKFGIGEVYFSAFVGQKTGFMPTKAWKKRRFKEKWHLGESLVAAIGQGFMLATPLEMVVMTARLCNGGMAVQPCYTKEQCARNPKHPIDISQTALSHVLEGMVAVCNEPGGTGYAGRIQDPNKAMAGKTGTSQVRRISLKERAQGVRDNQDISWKIRDHALFVGYAPIEAPRYAVCVVIEHGGYGGRVAVPIGNKILLAAQSRSDPKEKEGEIQEDLEEGADESIKREGDLPFYREERKSL